MTKILVTGSEGQLGQCFQMVAKDLDHKLFYLKKLLDITKPESLIKVYDQYPFEGIINCAAYSNVDKAEIEIDNAYKINKRGIQNLVAFAEKKLVCSSFFY